jgi:hypothetical protein
LDGVDRVEPTHHGVDPHEVERRVRLLLRLSEQARK